RDYKGQEVAFRLDRQGGRLVTKGEDIARVRDMLSVAESKGWRAVKLGGSQEFRREAWIEAATRDIEAQGYTPTDLDRQEAEKRRARR
ncbi:LPD7 domain-containing protein, partial [Staphylococcus aureus]